MLLGNNTRQMYLSFNHEVRTWLKTQIMACCDQKCESLIYQYVKCMFIFLSNKVLTDIITQKLADLISEFYVKMFSVLLCCISFPFPLPQGFSFTIFWRNCCIWIWKRRQENQKQTYIWLVTIVMTEINVHIKFHSLEDPLGWGIRTTWGVFIYPLILQQSVQKKARKQVKDTDMYCLHIISLNSHTISGTHVVISPFVPGNFKKFSLCSPQFLLKAFLFLGKGTQTRNQCR